MSKSRMSDEERKDYETKKRAVTRALEERDRKVKDHGEKKQTKKEIYKQVALKRREYDKRDAERKEIQSRKDNSDSSRPNIQRDLGRDKGINSTGLSKERKNGGSENSDLLPESGSNEIISKLTEAVKRTGNGTSKAGTRKKSVKRKQKIKLSKIIK